MNLQEWINTVGQIIKRCQEAKAQISKECKIWETLQKQISDAEARPFYILSLLDQLRSLNSPYVQELEPLETVIREKASEQIHHYGDLLKQALAPDAYEVEGRFPDYRICHFIEVHIDEQRHQARIRTPSYVAPLVRDISVDTVAEAVRKEARRLFGRPWASDKFLQMLYHAYRLALVEEDPPQPVGSLVRIWAVHRFVVWMQQKDDLFKLGKTFQPYPPDEFAVDIGRLLAEGVLCTPRGYSLHLSPVRDPREALFIVNFKTGIGQNYGFLSFRPENLGEVQC